MSFVLNMPVTKYVTINLTTDITAQLIEEDVRLAGKLQRGSKMMLKPAKIKVTWSRTGISEGVLLGK